MVFPWSSLSSYQRSLQEGGEPYEFVAFVIWYAFLVLCCLLPTCIAYRRRRRMERQLLEQQAQLQQRLQQSSQWVLTNNTHVPAAMEQVRSRILRQELGSTTTSLEKKHFVQNSASQQQQQPSLTPTITDTDEIDPEGENDYSIDEEAGASAALVRLDDDHTVPALCAVCISPFLNGESITWSPLADCQHAFHTDCIVPWLAKQQLSGGPKCPVCRQDFCEVVETTRSSSSATVPDEAFFRTFSQALLLSQLYGGGGGASASGVDDMAISFAPRPPSTTISESAAPPPRTQMAISFAPRPTTTTTESARSGMAISFAPRPAAAPHTEMTSVPTVATNQQVERSGNGNSPDDDGDEPEV